MKTILKYWTEGKDADLIKILKTNIADTSVYTAKPTSVGDIKCNAINNLESQHQYEADLIGDYQILPCANEEQDQNNNEGQIQSRSVNKISGEYIVRYEQSETNLEVGNQNCVIEQYTMINNQMKRIAMEQQMIRFYSIVLMQTKI